MKLIQRIAIYLMIGLTVTPILAQQPTLLPTGSYKATCSNCIIANKGTSLQCYCRNSAGGTNLSITPLIRGAQYVNSNGQLTLDPQSKSLVTQPQAAKPAVKPAVQPVLPAASPAPQAKAQLTPLYTKAPRLAGLILQINSAFRFENPEEYQKHLQQIISTATDDEINNLDQVTLEYTLVYAYEPLVKWLYPKGGYKKLKTPPLNQLFNQRTTSGFFRGSSSKELVDTAPLRVALAQYLIEQGEDVNAPDRSDNKALAGDTAMVALAKGIAFSTSYFSDLKDKLFIPLTKLYIKAGVTNDELQKARKVLQEKGCLAFGGCGSGCPACIVYGYYFHQEIDPLITPEREQDINKQAQDRNAARISQALEHDDSAALAGLVIDGSARLDQIEEMAAKAGKHALLQDVYKAIARSHAAKK